MKTLKDAIAIIMAQPPELHYPAYYADLLSEADVPEANIGKCSEIPNSSDLIKRQDAIDALSVGKEALSRVLDEIDVVDTDREKYSWGLGLIESSIKDIEELPSAEPERKKGKWIADALDNGIYHCSECGTDAPVEPTGGTEYKSNYCPNCGLDMRGETDED